MASSSGAESSQNMPSSRHDTLAWSISLHALEVTAMGELIQQKPQTLIYASNMCRSGYLLYGVEDDQED